MARTSPKERCLIVMTAASEAVHHDYMFGWLQAGQWCKQ
jgi:hypothetical protein